MGRRDNDIAAPDGYVLGGVRTVRRDGTILFQRGWWQAPIEWAGERVWVHEIWRATEGGKHGHGEELALEVAPPGLHIYDARYQQNTVRCGRTDRPDAKSAMRLPWHKVWQQRNTTT